MAARDGETALIVPIGLPPALEEIRRRSIEEAALGLPSHVTLLYPFAPPEALGEPLEAKIRQAVSGHAEFLARLVGLARWPGTLYATVEPEERFRSLQADLAAAFPEYPLHGGTVDFVPHVTIAEGEASAAGVAADSAPGLPTMGVVSAVELIVREADGWRTRQWFPLHHAVRFLVCGERLRRDDAAALLAVEKLPAEVRSLVEVVEVGQLSVEALLDVPDDVALIVSDAAVGVAAGQVVILPLAELARGGAGAGPASSHSLPPDQVLALAAEVRGSPPRGVFVGLGGEEFGFGEGLSKAVAAGLPAFVAALADEIRRLSESNAPGTAPREVERQSSDRPSHRS